MAETFGSFVLRMRKINKIVLILSMLALFGCDKESTSQCNCGTVANDGIDNNCYWLEIRNSCSGNKKKFCFDQDVWMEAYVGSDFCVTGESSW